MICQRSQYLNLMYFKQKITAADVLTFGFAVFLGFILTGCSGSQHPVDLSGADTKTQKLELGTIVERNLNGYVRLPGVLKPFDEVNIFPKVSGFIKEILVDRGSFVKKGQLLIRLEAPELLSAVEAANSKYVQSQETALASKEKYDRLKDAAHESGAVSPIDLDNALSKMKADAAISMAEHSNLNAERTMQSYLDVRAPFEGMITQRNVSNGALVGSAETRDQPLLVLQNLQKLRLEVYIPESYVDKVDLTQEVSYVLNALPGKILKAKISRSSNALGLMHAEAIEVDVINHGDQFKPGMYGEVKIPLTSNATSLVVPDNAIVKSTEREFIATVKNGRTALINIKEGLSSHDSTEVFGNIHAYDKIVLHANDELKEGEIVK